MALDDIENDKIDDAPPVKDPEVRTLLFDFTTMNADADGVGVIRFVTMRYKG